MNATIKAVLWDFGGVLTSSPFEAFNKYESAHHLPENFIRTVNATNPNNNAWARFEQGQLDLDAFDVEFKNETEQAGHAVSGRDVIALLSGDIRPKMVAALAHCNQHFKTACLTNNVRAGRGAGMAVGTRRAEAAAEVMALFDFVLESSKAGMRKPNPAFYRKALEALAVTAEQSVYLDDLGINLKPAKAMGMQTIKVISEEQALAELREATGLAL